MPHDLAYCGLLTQFHRLMFRYLRYIAISGRVMSSFLPSLAGIFFALGSRYPLTGSSTATSFFSSASMGGSAISEVSLDLSSSAWSGRMGDCESNRSLKVEGACG